MRRRDLLGGALAHLGIGTAVAQQRPRLAILHSGFPHRTPIEQLYAALRDLGYEHGRTADIQLLGAEGDPDRLTSFVAKLAQEHPQVIIAVTSPAALALKRANVTTPVVFLFVSDPIRLGLIESLPRPGGNYTGVTFSDAFLGAKRLELLADTVPGIRTRRLVEPAVRGECRKRVRIGRSGIAVRRRHRLMSHCMSIVRQRWRTYT